MRWLQGRVRNSRAPHVLVLNWRDPWHPEGGGSEVYVQQVTERLHDAGYEITVFTARYPGASAREDINGLTYVRRGGHLTVYLWAASLTLTRRFGHVDRVLEVQNGMPFLARLYARCPVVILVHHVHREQWPVVGPLLAKVGWFLESRVAVRVNRSAEYVVVSDSTKQELIGLGVDASRVTIAYNGLSPMPVFEPPGRSLQPLLVVLSRLVPHKQVEDAIATLQRLRGEIPGLHLVIMGSGWWEKNLRAAAADLGVDDSVTFLGHVNEDVKFAQLTRAWVHLMPSLKEGWGLSIIEAASVGVPSVAYRSAGGVQESIQEDVTGLLADNQDDLVDITRQLLVNQALREALGAKAAVRSAQFSWDTAAARMRSVLFKG